MKKNGGMKSLIIRKKANYVNQYRKLDGSIFI
jgi:hypothetical protein